MATTAQNSDLDMLSTSKILNLPDPTSAQDAATKAYVDAHSGGTFTASRAIVSNSSGALAVSTTTSAQIAALATLTNGRIPFSSGGALTDSANATLDSSGNMTLAGTAQAAFFTVKGQFNSSRQDMTAWIDLAGTYRWASGLDASNNLYFNDQVNNKDVLTLLAGATYTTARLPLNGTLSFNGGVTTIGLSSQATLSNTLEVNRGKILANSGSLANVLAFSYYVTGNLAATNYSRITGTFTGTWTATLPDASIVVAGSASALTSGRAPYVTTGGLLIDSAGYLFDGTSVMTLGVSGTSVGGVKLNNATSGSVTLQPVTGALGTVTASFPAASIVVAGSASALTSGRVPFATTGGLLTDSSSFTYSTSTGLQVGAAGTSELGTVGIEINGAVGNALFRVGKASPTTGDKDILMAYDASASGFQFRNRGASAAGISGDGGSLYIGDASSSGSPSTWGTRYVRFNVSTGKTTIGSSTSATGQLDVLAQSSSTIGQIIKLAASQSADALQVQDSTSAVLGKWTKDGLITISPPSGTNATYTATAAGAANAQLSLTSGGGSMLIKIDSGGNTVFKANQQDFYFDYYNALYFRDASSNNKFYLIGAGWSMQSGQIVMWSSSATNAVTSPDLGISRNAAGVLEVNNGTAGGLGFLLYGLMVGNKTSNYTVLSADKGCFFTNAGAAGEVDFTLPTAVAGLHYTFYVMANQVLKVIAGASTSIRIAGSNSAAAGNITNSTIGGSVTLVAVSSTQWVARDTQGTWTVT
jgi:hypothetical protein